MAYCAACHVLSASCLSRRIGSCSVNHNLASWPGYKRSSGRFWSSTRRNARRPTVAWPRCPRCSRAIAPWPACALLDTQPSRYRFGVLEGLVVRRESGDWSQARAKLVRADFTQTMEGHWRQRVIEWNRVDWSSASGLTTSNTIR